MEGRTTQQFAAARPAARGVVEDPPARAGFHGEELELIAAHGTRRTFAKGSVVVSEGDEALAFYVIVSGAAKVFTITDEGKEIVLRMLGPGDYFGELTLLDGGARSASVMATEACSLLIVPRAKFAECWADFPQICRNLLQQLSTRVRQLTDELKRVASMDVYQRLVTLLLELATRQGDDLVVQHRLTQQDLANRVCASREMVNRILHDLVAGGYIRIEQRQIVILRKLPRRW